MITSNGDIVQVITAAEAAQTSRNNPYDKTKILRAGIMDGIMRSALHGGCNHVYQTTEKLDKLTIDWLIALGYLVWHHNPISYKASNTTNYAYSIYFMFPDNITESFVPGEQWSANYPHEEQSGAV